MHKLLFLLESYKFNRKPYFIVLMILSLSSKAQHNFGLKVLGGMSYITTKFESSSPIIQRYYLRPTYQMGFYFNKYITKKTLFGSEFLVMQMEGEDLLKMVLIDPGGPYNGMIATTYAYRHITYFGLPIYFGYKIGRFNINGGIQINYAFRTAGESVTYLNNNKYSSSRTGYLNINPFNYGPIVSLILHKTNRLSFEINYYNGYNDLLKQSSISPYWHWLAQQSTIGIRYQLKEK